MNFADSATINTALITVTMFSLGLVSYVMRSLLADIQAQLHQLVESTAKGRVEAVNQLDRVVREAANSTDDRLERLTKAVELAARADLLRLIGAPDIRPEVKEQARQIVEEIANEKR
jgi:hypothetical protein